MKGNHLTKQSYLIKTNYFNYYSPRLLIGNILLTLPTLCITVMILIWGNLDFLLILPISLSMGILLVFPSTTTIVRPSKGRVAVDALTGGLAMMVILCLVSAKTVNLKEKELILRNQSCLTPEVTIEEYSPKDRNSKGKHLEHSA